MSGLQRAGAFARLLLPILLLITCAPAHANCIEGPNEVIRKLQTLAVSDSNDALARVQVMLVGSAAAKASPEDIAWLYAVRAQAYSNLELDTEARVAATEGMKLVPDPATPAHLALFFTDAENIYDAEGMAEAKRNVKPCAAGASAPRSSAAC
jgi:hypothetical protein